MRKDSLWYRVWMVVKWILFFTLYQVIGTCIAAGGVALVNGWVDLSRDLTTTIMEYGLLLADVALGVHLLFFSSIHWPQLSLKEMTKGYSLLSVLLILVFMYVMNIFSNELDLPNFMEETLLLLSKSVVGVIDIALLGPVVEELLFRGAILGYLLKNLRNPYWAIFISALLFGMIHMNPAQIFYAFFVGALFGWIYYRTGSLLTVIVGHILNNSMTILFINLWGKEEPEIISSFNLPLMLVSLLCLALLMGLVNRLSPSLSLTALRWRGEKSEGEDEQGPNS